jgi:hypothetical protein
MNMRTLGPETILYSYEDPRPGDRTRKRWRCLVRIDEQAEADDREAEDERQEKIGNGSAVERHERENPNPKNCL